MKKGKVDVDTPGPLVTDGRRSSSSKATDSSTSSCPTPPQVWR